MKNAVTCSFCGKTEHEVKKIVAGDGVYICDKCIALCMDILEEDGIITDTYEPIFKNIPKPSQIKAFLDQHVIGQDDAKTTLSVAVYNHYKRINQSVKDDEIELQKSNILLLGPTGSGKTFLAQTIAKMLHVPFAIADATTLTEAGYVGEDVENILLRLYEESDGDIEATEHGIIYLDEIDKISRKSENTSITRDVNGEGVQHALLKIIEGTVSRVPPQGGRKHPNQQCLEIDTRNILFICGGAFDGLEQILKNKTVHNNSIGFGAEIISKNDKKYNELMKDIEPQDLIRFGLVPELVGRLPVVTTLQTLDKDALLRILTEPKNAIVKQYQKLLEIDNIKLEFEKEALECIANKAIEKNTGARGLRAILENAMKNVMYSVPDIEGATKVVITKETVMGTGNPIIFNKKNKEIA